MAAPITPMDGYYSQQPLPKLGIGSAGSGLDKQAWKDLEGGRAREARRSDRERETAMRGLIPEIKQLASSQGLSDDERHRLKMQLGTFGINGQSAQNGEELKYADAQGAMQGFKHAKETLGGALTAYTDAAAQRKTPDINKVLHAAANFIEVREACQPHVSKEQPRHSMATHAPHAVSHGIVHQAKSQGSPSQGQARA